LLVCFPNVQNLVVLYPYILSINFTLKITNVFDINTSRRMYSYRQITQRQVKQNGGYERIHNLFYNEEKCLCLPVLQLWFKHWTVYMHLFGISLPRSSITCETAQSFSIKQPFHRRTVKLKRE